MQPMGMTIQLDAADFIAKACKAANFYEKGAIKDVIIKDAKLFTTTAPHNCQSTSPKSDLEDITFYDGFLLATKKGLHPCTWNFRGSSPAKQY